MSHTLTATRNVNSMHPNRASYVVTPEGVTVIVDYCDDQRVSHLSTAAAREHARNFRAMWGGSWGTARYPNGATVCPRSGWMVAA